MWNPVLSSSVVVFFHMSFQVRNPIYFKSSLTVLYVGDVVETKKSGENILVGKKDQRVKLGAACCSVSKAEWSSRI